MIFSPYPWREKKKKKYVMNLAQYEIHKSLILDMNRLSVDPSTGH